MATIGVPLDEKFSQAVSLMTVELRSEHDIVSARQRMRQIAELAGFEQQDQTRMATALSELSRNSFEYAGKGRVHFFFDLQTSPQSVLVKIEDSGPGISDIDAIFGGNYNSKTGMGVGLAGSRKLVDHFYLKTEPGQGTTIWIGKNLPKGRCHLTKENVARLVAELAMRPPQTPFDELQNQNHALIEAYSKLESREEELNQLNQELAETNRGVVALYAELDQKAETLQKVSEVKTSFLSNMTHEFRTPLNSIISLTRILLDRLDGDLTVEQEKQVTFIRKSAESLLELVNDLLDLGKVESGKISVNVTDFTVEDLFGLLRGMFRPILGPDGEIVLTFDPGLSGTLLSTDEAKVSQILRNLISNAIKFTEAGQITISAAVEGSSVVFCVADTGIGIAPEHFESVFEDYAQLDSKLQNRNKGTGLGLPLSRKLARLLGGDLWLESELGRGSKFFARVPRQYGGEKEEAIFGLKTERAANEKPPQHLLIVDDDPASRYILRGLLQSKLGPMRITEVETGEEALRAVERNKPDVLFLDLNLPGIGGIEVLRTLKSNDEFRSIPVIINTSRVLSETEKSRLLEIATGVLSKDRSDLAKAEEIFMSALVQAGLKDDK
jgi:signal transduction histidine kinase